MLLPYPKPRPNAWFDPNFHFPFVDLPIPSSRSRPRFKPNRKLLYQTALDAGRYFARAHPHEIGTSTIATRSKYLTGKCQYHQDESALVDRQGDDKECDYFLENEKTIKYKVKCPNFKIETVPGGLYTMCEKCTKFDHRPNRGMVIVDMAEEWKDPLPAEAWKDGKAPDPKIYEK
ncbi:MAG: hypothetical protein Q9160_002930 [Pyrenula sp. 1 TL-2023]